MAVERRGEGWSGGGQASEVGRDGSAGLKTEPAENEAFSVLLKPGDRQYDTEGQVF